MPTNYYWNCERSLPKGCLRKATPVRRTIERKSCCMEILSQKSDAEGYQKKVSDNGTLRILVESGKSPHHHQGIDQVRYKTAGTCWRPVSLGTKLRETNHGLIAKPGGTRCRCSDSRPPRRVARFGVAFSSHQAGPVFTPFFPAPITRE